MRHEDVCDTGISVTDSSSLVQVRRGPPCRRPACIKPAMLGGEVYTCWYSLQDHSFKHRSCWRVRDAVRRGGLGCCWTSLSTHAGLSVGARLKPAHYPGSSQLSSPESPGATSPAAREIQMFPVKSDGKSYKTLFCSKKGIKWRFTLCVPQTVFGFRLVQ